MQPNQRTTIHPLVLATLALGLTGAATGCTLSVEADLPDIQITQHGLLFEGAPGGEASMTKSYSQQHTKLDLPSGIDPQLKTLAVTLVANSGVPDLSFIEFLSVSMTPDGSDTPILLGSYEPVAGATAGNRIGLTTLNPVDVFGAWKTGSATFTLQIVGALPTNDWSGDVTVDLAASAKYTY
jgi:hypothetical protein